MAGIPTTIVKTRSRHARMYYDIYSCICGCAGAHASMHTIIHMYMYMYMAISGRVQSVHRQKFVILGNGGLHWGVYLCKLIIKCELGRQLFSTVSGALGASESIITGICLKTCSGNN